MNRKDAVNKIRNRHGYRGERKKGGENRKKRRDKVRKRKTRKKEKNRQEIKNRQQKGKKIATFFKCCVS